mmetsp:Transcript_6075/g.15202  ORF Transcript_6075/g.15202 Transcript_6075/m.15202 type:complete len:90 (-) Transcript_6075:393-662(-)
MTLPPSITTISSQSWMVLNLCAMITQVVCSPFPISFRLFMISNSIWESKLDVGSSHKSIGARFSIARARDTRCFSPPDIFNPRSPTIVL